MTRNELKINVDIAAGFEPPQILVPVGIGVIGKSSNALVLSYVDLLWELRTLFLDRPLFHHRIIHVLVQMGLLESCH